MKLKTMIPGAVLTAALVGAGAAAAQTPLGPQPAPSAGPPARGAPIAAAPATVNDPWEGVNRRLYRFNHTLDRVVLRPGVVFYHHATPTPIRRGLHNVLVNMTHPVIIINDALQLKPRRFATSLGRFVVNSTVGVGGVFDVATHAGLAYHNDDFGLTLARYGVASGPYVFVPVLGPSTVRDLVGRGVDAYADPLNSVRYDGREVLAPTRAVLGGIDARDQVDPLLKDIDRSATDPYATIRSAYLQNRAAEARGAATSAANVKALPDFGPEPAGPAPAATPTPAERQRSDGDAASPRAALDAPMYAPSASHAETDGYSAGAGQ